MKTLLKPFASLNEADSSFFNRKFVVLINPQTMGVLNYLDNGEMFEIFDTFAPAEKAVVSHEDAFEKLVSYISRSHQLMYLMLLLKNIFLCGLLDAAEGVDAVTGEVVPLSISKITGNHRTNCGCQFFVDKRR